MKEKRIEAQWKSFRQQSIDSDLPLKYVELFKHVFFSGAVSVLAVLVEDNDAAEAFLLKGSIQAEINDELGEFFGDRDEPRSSDE